MLTEATSAPSAPAPVTAPVQDGSFEAAAQAIANIRERTPEPDAPVEPAARTENRAPDGKFTKAETAKDEPAKDESATDDDDDYLELEEPGEAEGAEPKKTRLKLTEVWEGYNKAKTLEQELESARKASPPPAEWESATAETITERTRYADALSQWAQFNPVRAPNEDLMNPANPNYNPEAYWQQHQAFKQSQADHAAIKSEIERVNQINEKQANELLKAKAMRERSKVLEVWPELKDKAVAEKVIAEIKASYGFDDKTLSSVIDARFYALAKDALAHRSQQTARQEAVRKVVAKPKLVRAGARAATDGKTAARNDALGRLSRSGSLEDAAAAISNLK